MSCFILTPDGTSDETAESVAHYIVDHIINEVTRGHFRFQSTRRHFLLMPLTPLVVVHGLSSTSK